MEHLCWEFHPVWERSQPCCYSLHIFTPQPTTYSYYADCSMFPVHAEGLRALQSLSSVPRSSLPCADFCADAMHRSHTVRQARFAYLNSPAGWWHACVCSKTPSRRQRRPRKTFPVKKKNIKSCEIPRGDASHNGGADKGSGEKPSWHVLVLIGC